MPVLKMILTDSFPSYAHFLLAFSSAVGFSLNRLYRKDRRTMFIYLKTEQHVDYIMQPDIRAALTRAALEVVKSDKYLCYSTVIAKGIPASFKSKSQAEIAKEISVSNEVEVVRVDWEGEDTLAIELNTIEEATKILDASGGLRLGSECTITDIARKPYITVKQCTRCFSYEHDEPCPNLERTCYQCGLSDHVGEECVKNFDRCANCYGDHVALAHECPDRKLKEQEVPWAPCGPVEKPPKGTVSEDMDLELSKKAEEEISMYIGVEEYLLKRSQLSNKLPTTIAGPMTGEPAPTASSLEASKASRTGITVKPQASWDLAEDIMPEDPSQASTSGSPQKSQRKSPVKPSTKAPTKPLRPVEEPECKSS